LFCFKSWRLSASCKTSPCVIRAWLLLRARWHDVLDNGFRGRNNPDVARMQDYALVAHARRVESRVEALTLQPKAKQALVESRRSAPGTPWFCGIHNIEGYGKLILPVRAYFIPKQFGNEGPLTISAALSMRPGARGHPHDCANASRTKAGKWIPWGSR
jgi:hypothetical protein